MASNTQNAMLQKLLAFPPNPSSLQKLPDQKYDAGIRQIVDILGKTAAAKLIAPVSGGSTILNTVDPSTHPLPYEYALVASARAHGDSAAIIPGTPLYEDTLRFLTSFDPVQVRYGGEIFKTLLGLLLRGAPNTGDEMKSVVKVVVAALRRLDPSGATLTSLHLMVVEICLEAKAFDVVLPLLDKDIFHLPSPHGQETTYPAYLCSNHDSSAGFINEKSGLSDPLTYQDYLEYFLYGASIYIAKKNWRRALHFLDIVLATPVLGQAFSMIQVEAYKKWSLVHLLVHGRPGHNKHMLQPVTKHCQNLAKAYIGVVEKFKQPDTAKLQAEIEVGPFKDDCNFGLAMFTVAAHRRLKVANLALTYTSVSVREVTTAIGTASHDETDIYLQSLIRNHEIEAQLIPSPSGTEDALLVFTQASEESHKWNDLVKGQILTAQTLVETKKHMTDTQRRIELSSDYLVAVKKQRKSEENGKGSGKGGMADDEDVFGDDL